MTKIGLVVLGTIVLLGAGLPAGASAKQYRCPERITVTSNQIAPVTGFESWSDPQAEFFISGIDLYEGHPKDMVQLKPDNADDPDEAAGAVWTVAGNSKDLWMVCRYSDTNARVIRQLEDHEKFCAVKDIRGPEDSTAGGGVSLDCH